MRYILDNVKKAISILLVDDEPMILKSVTRYLQMRNCNITACHDGHAALEFNRHHFDAIVADFNLPLLDGLQLLKRFKITHPKSRLIMTSGSTTPESVIENGLDNSILFLSKPFELESLLSLIGV